MPSRGICPLFKPMTGTCWQQPGSRHPCVPALNLLLRVLVISKQIFLRTLESHSPTKNLQTCGTELPERHFPCLACIYGSGKTASSGQRTFCTSRKSWKKAACLLLYWYAKLWRKKSSTWDASRSYYLFLTLGIILGVTSKLTTPWYTYQLNIPNLAWQGTWLRNMERDLATHSCSLQWDAFSNKPVCRRTSSHKMKTTLFGACRKQRPMRQQLILMVQSGLSRCLTCRSKGHLQRCSPCWIVKSTAAIALKLFSASIRVLV